MVDCRQVKKEVSVKFKIKTVFGFSFSQQKALESENNVVTIKKKEIDKKMPQTVVNM